MIILATKVSRWKQKALKQPWFIKPDSTVLTRLQRMDKLKLLKKKPLAALQDDSVHYLNPTYVRWHHDEQGHAREVEYSTDIKKFYREEINAAMKSLAQAQERLSSTKSYTHHPQAQPPKKKTFLEVLYSKPIIEEVENEKNSKSSSSEEDSRMEEGQPDNIGIPPGGQEEFKTPDESDEDQPSTQETTKTSNPPYRTMEEMMKLMQTRIDTLEKTVQNQGFQYELALNKAQTEPPRKVEELLLQVEKASIKMREQEEKIEALTKIKVEEYVKSSERIITNTTDKIMQVSITRLSNDMDRRHDEYRQILLSEVKDEAVKLSKSMTKQFEATLKKIKTRIEDEHESTLMSNLDSYSTETVTLKTSEIDDLWENVSMMRGELQQGNITVINRPLKLRLAALDEHIEKARKEFHERLDAIRDTLTTQIKDVEMVMGNKTERNGTKSDLKTNEIDEIMEEKLNELERKVERKIQQSETTIDSQVIRNLDIARKTEDMRLSTQATAIETLKIKVETMEAEIEAMNQRESTEKSTEENETSPTRSNDAQTRTFHNQPTYIPGSARKNLFATPVEERAEAQMANDMAANMTSNVAKFEKALLHHDLHKSTVEIADLEDYYENLQGLCRSHQIPLVHRDQIRTARSCMPSLVSHMPEVIQSIAKQALYNKINSSFSEEPVILRNMITQNDEQDGYQVIYQIMSTFCHDLMDYPPTWGPAIDPTKDLWAYSKQLKRFRTQNGHKISYTTEEVAIEIIQQAMKIPKYRNLAQSLMSSYMTTRQNNLNMATFEKFTILSILARIDLSEHGNIPESPMINKGYAKDDGTAKPSDTGPRSRYPPPKMAKNRVTCNVCKTFGHNVPEQCCHFSAKMYHAQKYMDQNPDIAKTNAEQYEKRYDANIVKNMLANKMLFAGHLPEDEQDMYIDHLIDGMMRDDYSSNDGISQLTSTTEQLSISTPSKGQC